MLTITQILDKVLPYTKDELRCGFKKAKKLRQRADLIIQIADYRQGKPVTLPEEVLNLIDSDKGMF